MRARLATLAEVLVVTLVVVWFFAGVFRWQTGEPRRLGLGDWIDPYFINFLLEHWYHALAGGTNPLSLSNFYPVPHALGYSHSLILYTPFYMAVRPWLHPFLADTASLALVLVTGSTALYVVFRRGLGLNVVEALVASGFYWTSANAVSGSTGIWTQRASIFLVPLIAIVALAAMRERPTAVRNALAGCAGFLAAVLPAQDFYTGALTLLVIVLLAPGMLPVGPIALARRVRTAIREEARREGQSRPVTWRPPSLWWAVMGLLGIGIWIALVVHPIERVHIAGIPVSAHSTTLVSRVAFVLLAYFAIRQWQLFAWTRPAARAARARWPDVDPRILIAAAGAAIGLLLFLAIYAGAFVERHSFPEDQLLSSLKAFTGDTWRHPETLLTSKRSYPTLRGFALLLILAATSWAMPLENARRWRRHTAWFLAVSAIVLVIPYRIGTMTLWKMLMAPVPGLGAIRDPKRIIEPFELAIAAFAAVFLSQQRGRPWARTLIVVAMIGLASLDWNDATFEYKRDPALFDRTIRAPIAVDARCHSFFMQPESAGDLSRSDNPPSLYGVDASFLALYTRVPTLNGYSGWWPDDWRLSVPDDTSYQQDLHDWIEANALRGVCALDLNARTMTPYAPGR